MDETPQGRPDEDSGPEPLLSLCLRIVEAPEPDEIGQTYPLPAETVTIGRSTTSDIALLSDDEISRRHALLSPTDSPHVVTIEDRGSMHGTWVEDRRIDEPTKLWIGQSFSIGSTTLALHWSEQPAPAPLRFLVASIRRRCQILETDQSPFCVDVEGDPLTRGEPSLVAYWEGERWTLAPVAATEIKPEPPDMLGGWHVGGAICRIITGDEDPVALEETWNGIAPLWGVTRITSDARIDRDGALLCSRLAHLDPERHWSIARRVARKYPELGPLSSNGAHVYLAVGDPDIEAIESAAGTLAAELGEREHNIGITRCARDELLADAAQRAAGAQAAAARRGSTFVWNEPTHIRSIQHSTRPCPRCSTAALVRHTSRGSWICAACGELAGQPLQAPELGDVGALPFHIAKPLALSLDSAESADRRIHNALFAAYQAMRTTALLLLSDFIASDGTSSRLMAGLRGLRMPHWSNWTMLCDLLAKLWSSRLDAPIPRRTSFPEIVEAWREINGKKLPGDHPLADLVDGCDGLQGPARNLNDALWAARNHRAHRRGAAMQDVASDRELAERIVPLAATYATHLFAPGRVELWRRTDGDRGLRLVGARVAGSPDTPPFVWPGPGVQAVALANTRVVPLEPFIVPLPDDAEPARPDPLLVLDGITPRRATLLGLEGACESRSLATRTVKLLARFGVLEAVGRRRVTIWAVAQRSRAFTESRLERIGYEASEPIYVERPGVDDTLAELLAAPAAAVLVSGEAGSGKSHLLHRIAGQQLQETPNDRGDGVLLLAGADLSPRQTDSEPTLLAACARALGLRRGDFDTLSDLLDHIGDSVTADVELGRRIWLIIDSLDESPHAAAFAGELRAVLEQRRRFPWLRLAVGVRSEGLESLGLLDGEARDAWSPVPPGASGSPTRRYLSLRRFEPEEVATAYERARREGRALCPIPFDELSPSITELLRLPLLVGVFHRAFANVRELPDELDHGQLLGRDIERVITEAPLVGQALELIGRDLYDHRRGWVSLEIAHRLRAAHLADCPGGAEATVSLDPVEALVTTGFIRLGSAELGEANQPAYLFRHARLCERLIYRELLRQAGDLDAVDADQLERWAQHVARPPIVPALLGGLLEMIRELERAGRDRLLARIPELDAPVIVGAMLDTMLAGSRTEERIAELLSGMSGDAAPAGRVADALERRWRAMDDAGATEAALASARTLSRWCAKHRQAIPERFPKATLALARSSVRAGDRELAAQALDRALRQSDLPAGFGLKLVGVELGALEAEAGELATARRRIEAAIARLRDGLPRSAADLGFALLRLGDVTHRMGDTEEAQKLRLEALEQIRACGSTAAHLLPGALNAVAEGARDADRPEEAIPMLEEAISRVWRPGVLARATADHIASLSTFASNLGRALRDRGDVRRAVKALQIADQAIRLAATRGQNPLWKLERSECSRRLEALDALPLTHEPTADGLESLLIDIELPPADIELLVIPGSGFRVTTGEAKWITKVRRFSERERMVKQTLESAEQRYRDNRTLVNAMDYLGAVLAEAATTGWNKSKRQSVLELVTTWAEQAALDPDQAALIIRALSRAPADSSDWTVEHAELCLRCCSTLIRSLSLTTPGDCVICLEHASDRLTRGNSEAVAVALDLLGELARAVLDGDWPEETRLHVITRALEALVRAGELERFRELRALYVRRCGSKPPIKALEWLAEHALGDSTSLEQRIKALQELAVLDFGHACLWRATVRMDRVLELSEQCTDSSLRLAVLRDAVLLARQRDDEERTSKLFESLLAALEDRGQLPARPAELLELASSHASSLQFERLWALWQQRDIGASSPVQQLVDAAKKAAERDAEAAARGFAECAIDELRASRPPQTETELGWTLQAASLLESLTSPPDSLLWTRIRCSVIARIGDDDAVEQLEDGWRVIARHLGAADAVSILEDGLRVSETLESPDQLLYWFAEALADAALPRHRALQLAEELVSQLRLRYRETGSADDAEHLATGLQTLATIADQTGQSDICRQVAEERAALDLLSG